MSESSYTHELKHTPLDGGAADAMRSVLIERIYERILGLHVLLHMLTLQ